MLSAQGEDAGKEHSLRGLSIKYLRITSKVWKQEEVTEELHKVRGDEEA